MSKEDYGKAEEWEEFGCEKCGEAVYLNENYIGLVLCIGCMDKVFPE